MRSLARECAFKIIFSEQFNGKAEESLCKAIFKQQNLSNEDIKFANKLISLVEGHNSELIENIEKFTIGYSKDRIYAVDKSILLLAMAEILYVKEVPNVVSVDEAVGLVKKYSTENSAGFINGVLASFVKAVGDLKLQSGALNNAVKSVIGETEKNNVDAVKNADETEKNNVESVKINSGSAEKDETERKIDDAVLAKTSEIGAQTTLEKETTKEEKTND